MNLDPEELVTLSAERSEMIPYSEDKYGFTYGSAKIVRAASDAKLGWVMLLIDTPKGSVQIGVTKTGFISVDGIRVVPPKRSGKKGKSKALSPVIGPDEFNHDPNRDEDLWK